MKAACVRPNAGPLIAAGLALAALPLPAMAAAARAPAGVCAAGADGAVTVDRGAVARALLKTFAIGVADLDAAAYQSLGERLRAGADLNTAFVQVVLADAPNRFAIVTNKKVRYPIEGWYVRYPSVNIAGAPATRTMTWAAFFADTTPIACDGAQAAGDKVFGAPKPAPPVVAAAGDLRVRGTPDQLAIAAGTPAFNGATPATFSILRDGVARTTSYKVIGSVGFPLIDQETPNNPTGAKAIVFANVNYAAVDNFAGASKPPQSNEVDAGVVLARYFKFNDPLAGENPVTHQGVIHQSLLYVAVMPDYLWNQNDHSQIFTANLAVTPRLGIPIGRLTSGTPDFLELNDYRNVGTSLFSWEPLVVLKFDGGTYTHLGLAKPTLNSRTIARGGGQFGVNLLSDDKNLPFTLNVSYIYLDSLTAAKDIGYLSTALTFSPAANKNFGVTLNYNNGNLEATAKRQEQTTVGFSFKY